MLDLGPTVSGVAIVVAGGVNIWGMVKLVFYAGKLVREQEQQADLLRQYAIRMERIENILPTHRLEDIEKQLLLLTTRFEKYEADTHRYWQAQSVKLDRLSTPHS